MDRIVYLSNLYKESVDKLTKSRDDWEGLLSSMAKYYKYSFDNNVLIHVQRPGAGLLAAKNIWNKKIGRKVNTYAKGLSVIDLSNPKASFKYLFDLMDTSGSYESFRYVISLMWELEDQYKPDVISRLHDQYGTDNSSIESSIYELAERHITENLPGYLQGFSVADPDSMLYGFPVEAVKEQFAKLVHNSIEYMVFKKCGLPTDMFEEDFFENIDHFNSMWLFTRMGSIIMSIARPILREIHMEIENIKHERSKDNEPGTFDRPDLLRRRGRTTIPKYSNIGGRAGRPDGSGQIRENVEGIHGGTTPIPYNGTDNGRNVQQDGNGSGHRSGEQESGANSGAFESAAHAGHREHIGERSTHENDLSNSGGNNNQRNIENKITQIDPLESSDSLSRGFLRYGTDKPNDEPGESEYAAGQNETTKIADPIHDNRFSQEIDSFLMFGKIAPGYEDWRIEIFKFFTEENQTLLLKSEAIKFFYYIYGKLDGVYHTDNGMEIYAQATDQSIDFKIDGHKLALTYLQIAERIDRLIHAGTYVFSEDKSLNDSAAHNEANETNDHHEDHKELNVESNSETPAVEVIPNLPPTTREQIIEKLLLRGNITEGGKKSIQNAILSMESKKDRISFVRKAYGYVGEASPLDNGGHFRWLANPKGINIDYDDGALKFEEILSWNKIESLITTLVSRGVYLEYDNIKSKTGPSSEEAEHDSELWLEPYTVVKQEKAKIFTPDHSSDQISIFDGFIAPSEAYEDMETGNNDNIIDENTVTVNSLDASKDLKHHYEDGETAPKMEDAAQNGEILPGAMEDMQPAQPESNATGSCSHTIMDDLMSRINGNGLNYRYSPDHNLYNGGQKTKCRHNIEAIRLLKGLQAEGRPATADEQIILAKFVGWGGLANALTPDKSGWEKEYGEITALLTEEEFKSAQESTTTAFYTGQDIIVPIYHALERFGFHGGNILDPAMGTGNFFSALPVSMSESQLYGVELDSITGGIAKQLYPDADIEVKGFENTYHPDYFFDAAIGNIPFNSYSVNDKRYDKYNFRIHDYFIAKTLDKVRSGGIIAFITSKFTLDKANPAIRKYIAQRAELIGAIRLPNNAFKTVSGTEATTDIIFLQKREKEIVPDEHNNSWIHIEKNADGIPLNSYFVEHPEMILGTMVFDISMYGNEQTTACHPYENAELDKLLENAVHSLNCQYREPATHFENDKETVAQESIPADPNVKNFSYALVNDKLYYREHSRMYKQSIKGKKLERIKGMLEIRSALRYLIQFQMDSSHSYGELPTMTYESEMQEYMDVLNQKYDTFIKRYGYINSRANVTAFSKDSDAPLLRSIEKETEKDVFQKAAVFYKATVKPRFMPKSVASAEEALKMSLNVKGRINLEYMQWLYKKMIQPNRPLMKSLPS